MRYGRLHVISEGPREIMCVAFEGNLFLWNDDGDLIFWNGVDLINMKGILQNVRRCDANIAWCGTSPSLFEIERSTAVEGKLERPPEDGSNFASSGYMMMCSNPEETRCVRALGATRMTWGSSQKSDPNQAVTPCGLNEYRDAPGGACKAVKTCPKDAVAVTCRDAPALVQYFESGYSNPITELLQPWLYREVKPMCVAFEGNLYLWNDEGDLFFWNGVDLITMSGFLMKIRTCGVNSEGTREGTRGENIARCGTHQNSPGTLFEIERSTAVGGKLQGAASSGTIVDCSGPYYGADRVCHMEFVLEG